MLDKLEVDTAQSATITARSSSGPNPIILNASIETDRNDLLSTTPNIRFNDYPVVEYPLGGKTIRYQFGNSDSVDTNSIVELSDWGAVAPDTNLRSLLNIGFVGGVQTK